MKTYTFASAVALLSLALTIPSHAQRLRAAGVSGSFNIARLHTGQPAFQLGAVTVDPQQDQSNDETGNGITLFGRWQLGRTEGWYVQPEIGYTSTLATPVDLTHSRGGSPYWAGPLRHLDARLLGGYQAGPLRLFAGPGLSYFLRHASPSFNPNDPDPDLNAARLALSAAPPWWQPTVQVGAGVSLWRLDLNARYEWGLQPYSRTINFQQQSQVFSRNLQQLILEVGFQIYKRPAAQ